MYLCIEWLVPLKNGNANLKTQERNLTRYLDFPLNTNFEIILPKTTKILDIFAYKFIFRIFHEKRNC